MRLQNQYKEKVFWRAFKYTDTGYGIGLREGVAEVGETVEWVDDSFSRIKVEVKTGSILFPKEVLASAGRIFSMGDDLLLHSNGELKVAKVKFGATTPQTIEKSEIQFVDLRGDNKVGAFKGTAKSVLKSTFQNVYTASTGFERANAHSQTWTIGGKVGGTIGKKDAGQGNAEIRVGFTDVVSETLKEQHKNTVTNLWKKEWTDELTFETEKIHAIEFVWRITLLQGVTTYFGQAIHYSVIQDAVPFILKLSSYDTESSMPKRYQNEHRKKKSPVTA